MSIYNDLLNAVKGTIDGLTLTFGTQAIPTIVSEEPLNREVIEPTPLPNIFVTPPAGAGEQVQQLSTENLMDVVYPVEISIVAAGNAQFEANLPSYLDLRQILRQAFQRVHYPSILGMWFVLPKPKQVLNIDLQRDNYDLSILTIDFSVAEAAVKA